MAGAKLRRGWSTGEGGEGQQIRQERSWGEITGGLMGHLKDSELILFI